MGPNDKHFIQDKRRADRFVAQLSQHFVFTPDWHQRAPVLELVSSYLELLSRILASRRDLCPCHTRCRICGIEFLTHPRNIGRDDIRCYFGCQAIDCARKSTARSTDYNRSPEGKLKKQQRHTLDDSAAAQRLRPDASSSPVLPVSMPATVLVPLPAVLTVPVVPSPASSLPPSSAPAPPSPRTTPLLPRATPPIPPSSSPLPSLLCHLPRTVPLAHPALPALVHHLVIVVGLIERRRVDASEILAVLGQQGIAFGRVFAQDRPP